MTTWLRVTIVATVLGLVACGDDDGGTPDGGGGGGQAPSISRVTWTRMGSCTAGTPSNYLVVTTASDADTAMAMLTVNGTVSSCTPFPFSDFSQVLRCPNAASYSGNVTVRDPQGNSDSQSFTMSPCDDGQAP